MPISGVRELPTLSEFTPFGLTAELMDGGNLSDDDNYHYFLFDPQVAKQHDEAPELDDAFSERSDHELFIRGNRIIWSTGPKVYKRFTLPSKVIKVCWCRMGDSSEALVCVLQVDRLTIHGIGGEVVSIPLPHAVASIWSLPFGLLLQRAAEGSLLTNISLSSSNPYLSSRDVFRQKRDAGYSPLYNTQTHIFDQNTRTDGISLSSHLILKDPFEEPQITYVEERGKLNLMWEFDERTIWTSECVPLMASYNKGKTQHSLWVIEVNNSNLEVADPKASDLVAPGKLAKPFFRRIWQGKGSQTAASKVFLATDDDATPIVCFLLLEQKKLLSLRLQSMELDNETVYDIKPDMSWSIPAIAAAAVTVTRPKVKVGQLPHMDIIALTPENTLLLYSGKLCLCKYVLPSCLGKEQLSRRMELSGTNNITCDLKIINLADAVEGRFNLILNNGRNYRCTLRRSPSSSLTNDCITAMAEGLSCSVFNHFLGLLWGDNCSTYLVKAYSRADSEWESFCNVITKMCQRPNATSQLLSDSVSHTSWEFLTQSNYNQQYLRSNCISGNFPGLSSKLQGSHSSNVVVADTQNTEETFCLKFLRETLDSLHAVYETLKLNNLRKRDMGLLVVLLYDIANFLQELGYLDHYSHDFPSLLKDIKISQNIYTSRTPPSLFRWIENCLKHGCSSASISDLPPLVCKGGSSVVNWARKIVSFYSLLCGVEQAGNKLSSGVTCEIAPGSYHTREELTVLGMVGEGFALHHLDLLPAGVSLP